MGFKGRYVPARWGLGESATIDQRPPPPTSRSHHHTIDMEEREKKGNKNKNKNKRIRERVSHCRQHYIENKRFLFLQSL